MPSFSSVVQKPGKKFTPKTVPRRHSHRVPYHASTSTVTNTQNPQFAPGTIATSARDLDSPDPLRTLYTAATQAISQAGSNGTGPWTRQKGSLATQSDTTNSYALTLPPSILSTSPFGDGNPRGENDTLSEQISSSVEVTSDAALSAPPAGPQERATRSTPSRTAGSKRTAAEAELVLTKEGAPKVVPSNLAPCTITAAAKSRVPSRKRQKITNASTARSPAPPNAGLLRNGILLQTARNQVPQPTDSLLQTAMTQFAAVSRLAEGIEGDSRPSQKSNAKMHKRPGQAAGDAVSDAVNESIEPQSYRHRGRKRAKKSLADVAAEIIAEAFGEDAADGASRRNRQLTPEDAEEHRIKATEVTMGELTKDTRLGKKSLTEAAMQQINWNEVAERRKKEALEKAKKREERKAERQTGKRPKSKTDAPEAAVVPQTMIVAGRIVVDESSRVIDRGAGLETAAAEATNIVEEARITKRVNQMTVGDQKGLKQPGSGMARWDREMTERFYKGLRMFGTDFMMISALFPGLQRRHIKLKYVREERENWPKIQESLTNKEPVDLAEFEQTTGKEMVEPDQLKEELAALEAAMRKKDEERIATTKAKAHPQETILQSREQGSAERDVLHSGDAGGGDPSQQADRFATIADGIVRDATGPAKKSRRKKVIGTAPAIRKKKTKDSSIAISRKAAKAAKTGAAEGAGTVEAIGTVDEVPR